MTGVAGSVASSIDVDAVDRRRLRASAIICCYTQDRFGQVLDAIDSLLDQTIAAHEIIVVVDHNGPLAQQLSVARPHVRIVESDEEVGISGARNAGLNVASGEVVTFLDDDATAERNWLEGLLEAYRDRDVIGAAGAGVPRWESTPPAWLPHEFYWVIGCSWAGLPETAAPTRNLTGPGMSFLRVACLAVGGFARDFYATDREIFCEETEFSIRLTQHFPGRKLIYLPDVRAHHCVPRDRTTVRYFVGRCWREGRAKRITARLVGAEDGLSRERAHLTRVLPRAGWTALGDLFRGDRSALGRVAALIGGTLVTALSFALPRTAPGSGRGGRDANP
jgi:glucosyl-dolichyl phosphate glucuronosyltransferase